MRHEIDRLACRSQGVAEGPPDVARELIAKLQKVADEPQGVHPWAKRLKDQAGFRARQGDWRAIYRLDHARSEMVVERIAKRDEVYR